ncbi:MAG: L-iditol 2-dehydrogenase [Firmicutes bacterium]|nr:L-iditol 2-dehydrogenase [Bacillota bacterium]
MLALVKTASGHGNLEVLEKEEPTVGKDQVKILVKYAGICGSDLHTYEGTYKVNIPVTLGHEFAGEVVEIGENVREVKVGDRVTSETTFYICGECRYCKSKDYNLCSARRGLGSQQDGGFAKYVVARKESIHILPENVDYLSASITEALACAYHAVGKCRIQKNNVVVVLGPGPIGLLVAQVVKTYGAKVVIAGLTKDRRRLDKAKELGIEAAVDILTENTKEIVDVLTDGYGADIVFECTGAPPSVNLGLDILAKKGNYVQVGMFPMAEISVDFEKVIQKELQVIGSRTQKPSDWDSSLALINNGSVNTKALVSHQFNITEWDQAYDAIKSGAAIKAVIHV